MLAGEVAVTLNASDAEVTVRVMFDERALVPEAKVELAVMVML